MLKLNNIVKDYEMPGITVHALKGVSLNFRKSEFVAILGPSGCGKTTLLNIIGGLDRYTDGDLVIKDRSTKEYQSRDWDKYRNQTIGFIFQSYNLIPHLNVLQNVELALTISGAPHSKKRSTAKEALTKVGLLEHIKKKPTQMSGGQMQRVAIARAIVNNPEIILADEPTGALDSATSEQIMDLLQEISVDRLVIMVTHNPELAERYATRIIKLKDGELVSDSNPYDGLPTVLSPVKPIENEEDFAKDAITASKKRKPKKAQRPKKSTKKQAVEEIKEEGTVEKTEEQTDEKFVAQITPEHPEQLTKIKKKPKEQKVKSSMNIFTALSLSARNLWTKKARTALTAFAGSIGIIGIALVLSLSNGFSVFMNDLETSTLSTMPVTVTNVGIKVNVNEALPDTPIITPYEPDQSMQGVKVSANIITDEYVDYVKGIDKSLLSSVQYQHSMSMTIMAKTATGGYRYTGRSSIGWQELLWDDFMKSQYDVLAGGYPGSEEARTVLETYDDKYSTYPESEIKAHEAVLVITKYNTLKVDIMDALGYNLNAYYDPTTNTYVGISFDEFLGKQLKIEHNDDLYEYNPENGLYKTKSSAANLENAWNSDLSESVVITGIMRVKQDVLYPFLNQGIAYTEDLTTLALANAAESEIAIAQIANKDKNLLNGASFTNDMSGLVSIFSTYGFSEAQLVTLIKDALKSYYADNEYIKAQLEECNRVNDVISVLNKNGIPTAVIKAGVALMAETQLGIDSEVVMELLNSAYQSQLQNIGASDRPSAIYIYPASFDAKKVILDYLDEWNEDKAATETIMYTDLASTVAEIVEKVVDIVSYVLIAFAAISLVVSSIMIAIITYISVLERTVEIGVLRSIGARKLDVANVFNAETSIVGFISGLLGVAVAWILDFPINMLLCKFVEQAPPNLAQLNPLHALLLVALSIVLNIIAGFIPSIIASKKDPVIALRSGG
ncbi:MAG: ABC transporter ATP-binding protein/permease [Clostridia bacterium]|nr:ABC transporter ATP-binding protein/permease [Clostridia bacterium]